MTIDVVLFLAKQLNLRHDYQKIFFALRKLLLKNPDRKCKRVSVIISFLSFSILQHYGYVKFICGNVCVLIQHHPLSVSVDSGTKIEFMCH